MTAGARFDGYLADQVVRVGPSLEKPSPIELRTISCMAAGLTMSMAAEVLGCAMETVKSHLRDARRRAAAKNTVHLVAICLREGWIQ